MADITGQTYPGQGFIGYLTELRVGQGGSPELFVAVADVRLITPGDMTTGTAELTHLRSPDGHREWLLTLRDSGEFSVVGNYRPGHGSHTVAGGDGFNPDYSLVSLWKRRVSNNFEIVLPPTAAGGSPSIVLEFAGGVTKYQIGAIGLDTIVDFTASIRPLRAYTLP